MYVSINYSKDNTYLVKTDQNLTLCKNNFSYSLNNKYNKIIGIIQNLQTIDTITISEIDYIPLNINTNWGIGGDQNDIIKKNILLPSIKNIDLIHKTPDLNTINCLCQDHSNISHLPKITLNIDNDTVFFKKWTGYNQIWCCNSIYNNYIAYAYLYFFQSKAIFMCSISNNETEINHHNDLDIISVYNYNNSIRDEFGRINCNHLKADFNTTEIINIPLDRIINQINIKTTYEELLPN